MFGRLHWVENLDKKSASSSSYWRILVKTEDGVFETLLLTPSDLSRCRDRATKNPEDLLVPSLWDRVRAFLPF